MRHFIVRWIFFENSVIRTTISVFISNVYKSNMATHAAVSSSSKGHESNHLKLCNVNFHNPVKVKQSNNIYVSLVHSLNYWFCEAYYIGCLTLAYPDVVLEANA